MDWKEFTESCYYIYVFNPIDREVFRALNLLALHRGTSYYENGMLIVNAKIKTICYKVGVSQSTVKRSLKKLERLGAIVRLTQTHRNIRYLIGFRDVSDNRMFLVWYLAEKFEPFLKEFIENQKQAFGKKWQTPFIKDTGPYSLEPGYKTFIKDYHNQPNILLNRCIKDDKNMPELLFKIDRVHRKPISNTIKVAQNELPR